MLAVNIVGLSILAVFLLFILPKKNKRKSDYTLIVTIMLISVIFVASIWLEYEVVTTNFILINTISYYILPAYVSYALLLIGEEKLIRKNLWWYGIYAPLFTLFILLDFTLFNGYSKEEVEAMHGNLSWTYHLFHKSYKLYLPLVLFWFLRKLKGYRFKIRDVYSSIESIRLKWLRNFTVLYITVTILSVPVFLASDLGYVDDVNKTLAFFNVILVIGLFYLCYNGIRQYSLASLQDFQQINAAVNPPRSISDDAKKYQSSSLSDEEMCTLFRKIESLFKNDEVYLEPQLKILDIANELGTTTHRISQTINSKTSGRFYDYVNQYRAEHFRQLLIKAENRRFTILSLGIESGFNSKASMNRIFKQITGQSPREFQRSAIEGEDSNRQISA